MSFRAQGINHWNKMKKLTLLDLIGDSEQGKQIASHVNGAMSFLLPKIQYLFSAVVMEAVIIPRIVIQQLIALGILRGGLVMVGLMHSTWMWLKNRLTPHGRKGRKLRQKMYNAESYYDWKLCAEELDHHEHEHMWRYEDGCTLYDEQGLRKGTDDLEKLIEKGDIFNLMFKLRGGLSRTQFGILREGLFQHSRAGTKTYIEEYLGTVVTALCTICDSDITPNMSSDADGEGAAPSSFSFLHSTLSQICRSKSEEVSPASSHHSMKSLEDKQTGLRKSGGRYYENTISTDSKLAFFNEMRHAYGRTALMMSGGASLGYYHIGMVGALLEQGLLPRVISGSSAGSIMAATVGTRTNEELAEMVKTGKGFRLDFGKPCEETLKCPIYRWCCGDLNSWGIYKKAWKKQSEVEEEVPYHEDTHDEGLWPPVLGMLISGLWRYPFNPFKACVCDTDHLATVIKDNCGDYTFQEAFERTGRIVNITVAPHNRTDPPRLLNYLTAPHVLMRSAALASSAVPGIFKPQQLLVKDVHGNIVPIGVQHSDGSLENDLPSAQLSELFNINHFIVSQVNPHGVLLSSLNSRIGLVDNADLRSSDFSFIHKSVVGIMSFLQSQIRAWGIGLLSLICDLMGSPSWQLHREQLYGISAVVTQMYEGRCGHDINILPWNHDMSMLGSVLHLLDTASMPDYFRIIKVSERNTYPKMPRIIAHCVIEACLERCVQRLRHRLGDEIQAELVLANNEEQNKLNMISNQEADARNSLEDKNDQEKEEKKK